MTETEERRPWWIIPSGRVRPIWWLAVVPAIVAIDYAGGPDSPYPLLYAIAVCAAAWYSGQLPSLLLAACGPLVHLVLLLTVWHAPLTNIPQLIIRGVMIALIGFVFARQAEYERAFRREMQRRHEIELRAEQLRVVHVTMRSVEDIVNNCLNQLLLLRIEAEGLVPAESLEVFDQAVAEASAKLKTLAELQAFAEKQMEIGTGLDVGVPS